MKHDYIEQILREYERKLKEAVDKTKIRHVAGGTGILDEQLKDVLKEILECDRNEPTNKK